MRQASRWLTLLALLAVIVGGAATQKKSKKKTDLPMLQNGDVVQLTILGDEAAKRPKLSQSRVVTADDLTFPRVYGNTELETEWTEAASDEFYAVAINGDRVGVDEMVEKGRAVRVRNGQRVIVATRYKSEKYRNALLPVSSSGMARVKIMDGPTKGLSFDIPVRNLKPLDPPKER